FREIRDRAPALGTEEEIVNIFLEGLCGARIKECIKAELADDPPLPTVVSLAVKETKRLINTELEHKALSKERLTLKSSSEPETTDTGEKPPSERFEKIGKRRSTRTHTPYRHRRSRRVPFIKNRDPRYKRFFPGVKCEKCGNIGHYTHVCQDDTNGSKGKLEYLCAFGTSEKPLFTSLATINAPSQTTAISVSVLFDTGASTSVIDRKCVEELGITPKKASHTSA
ncbi:hypothetical protein ADUPG1_002957, partial [Aduncisulcus paluster]